MLRTTGKAIAKIAAITALTSGALMVSGGPAMAATTAQTGATVVTVADGGHKGKGHGHKDCGCGHKHKKHHDKCGHKHDKCKHDRHGKKHGKGCCDESEAGHETSGGDANGNAKAITYCFGGNCNSTAVNVPIAGDGGAAQGPATALSGWGA